MGRHKRDYAVTKKMIEFPTHLLLATQEKLKTKKISFTQWLINQMAELLK